MLGKKIKKNVDKYTCEETATWQTSEVMKIVS